MEKLQKVADKYLLNTLTFKILMIVAVMITAVPYLHMTFGKYVKFILMYGFLVIGYELITGKLLPRLKDKTNWLLIGFCVSYAITLFINRDSAFAEGIKSFAYVVVFFVLFFISTQGKSKESLIKEIQIISGIIIGCTFILSFVSMLTYAFSISGHYSNSDGIYIYYGLFENRLWGLYNPNTGSTLNSISILLSVAFMITVKRKWVIILNAINVFLQYSCLLLTGSRAAYYIVLMVLIALSVFVVVRKFDKINLRSIVAVVVCVAVVTGSYIGLDKVLKEGYAYLPSVIDIITYEEPSSTEEPETLEGEEPNEDDSENEEPDEKPTLNKQDFTRLEETENREGGFFNGREEIWVACLKTFKEAPLFGVGNENLISDTLDHFEDDTWKEHFRTGGSHNIYVCMLVSSGIAGCILMGAFAIITLLKSGLTYLKRYKKASLWLVVSIGMCAMFYISEFVEARIMFYVSTFSVIFWLYIGYMYRLASLEKEESKD